jgi:hypothetical protein
VIETVSPNPTFLAAGSAAGYYYQARVALVEALKFAYSESGIDIAIERLDDVSFEKDGTPLELLQTKHHISKVGDLTDTSPDIWRTLRVWCENVKKDPSLPSRTRFTLITTAEASEESAASCLRPQTTHSQYRDVDAADSLLMTAATSSTNVALASAFEIFRGLTPEMRKSLLTAIEVLDRAPQISDLELHIEDGLKMIAPRGKVSIAREHLEGWWWSRICKALQQEPVGVISILELEAKLDDIREVLKRDALPTEMEHVDPPDTELKALDEMTFVLQLRSVGLGEIRVQYAKRDYYRAFTQRSRWTRQNLLFDGEVTKFEKTLVEEWQPRFHSMCGDLDIKAKAPTIRAAGQKLYHWVETEARFPFRTVAARFLNVGSYHMLANEVRVGWHRDYATKFVKPPEGSDGNA